MQIVISTLNGKDLEWHVEEEVARQSYDELYQALERADSHMAATARDCAQEMLPEPLTQNHPHYWSALREQLEHAAFYIWAKQNRDASAETGLPVKPIC